MGGKNGNGIRLGSFPPDTPHFNVEGSSTACLRWWASCKKSNIEMGVVRGDWKDTITWRIGECKSVSKTNGLPFFPPIHGPLFGVLSS